MNITQETKAHAQAIVDLHVANPGHHDQSFYIGGVNGRHNAEVPENLCGTTLCIAGTSDLLDQGYVSHYSFSDASLRLGLGEWEAVALFYCENESDALDMTLAIANGDPDKFRSVVERPNYDNMQAQPESILKHI